MHRLKRHIVTEIGEVFLAVVITLILIMLSFQFVMLLNQAANGKIVGAAIFKLLSLHAVNLFVELTPFAFFIACLITLTRLASDRELIAMQSLGMGIKGLYQAIFYITLPLALFMLYLTLFMLPTTLSLYQELTQQAKKESELSVLQPGSFRNIGKNTTIFVSAIDENNAFSRFFIWQRNQNSESITVALAGKQIEEKGKRYIELTQGSRFQQDAGNANIISFNRFLGLLPSIAVEQDKDKVKAKSTQQLFNDPSNESRIEFQRRISPAISIILLALFSPILVQFNPRENRYGRFIIAILTYLLYVQSQYIIQALVENDKFPTFPGVYFSHFIFFILVMLLILRNPSQMR